MTPDYGVSTNVYLPLIFSLKVTLMPLSGVSVASPYAFTIALNDQ